MPAPDPNDPTRTLIVTVHGIGDQKRFATIQSVAHRLGRYLDVPGLVSLGQLHSAPARVEAFSLPGHPEIGLAEVFWADIPRDAKKNGDTLEETKAWALTVVERLRNRDREKTGNKDSVDYQKTRAVVAEMIETIGRLESLLSIADKAGLGKFELGNLILPIARTAGLGKSELSNLLGAFLGNVEVVAEYRDYGGRIFEQVGRIMNELERRHPNVEKIYFVAHSEGTVIFFRALLDALAHPVNLGRDWVDRVRGLMTIGSPIDVHMVLWPQLWEAFKKPAGDRRGQAPTHRNVPINWWNYYDYGDPVGFGGLDITRQWLTDNDWIGPNSRSQTIFNFPIEHEVGFTRYPFPGKAHGDYWEDQGIFDHFFKSVLQLRPMRQGFESDEDIPRPGSIWICWVVSWCVPYFLFLLLLMGGTYVLYHAQEPFTGYVPRWEMIRTIIGLALFIAGITFVSRVPRLVKFGSWNVVLLGFFALGSWAYCSWVALSVQESLAKGFADWPTSDPQWKIIGVGYIIAVFSAIWSKLRPSWGMKPLMFLATGLTLCTVIGIISAPNTHVELSAWPLFLAGLGFLYLWWLAALIFDLVFVWHHYIRSNAAGDFLKSIYRR